jgi:serine/threonine-protein kinase
MLGTPSYMSPEQCRGLKDIDHRADLWALGVITYECLVGKVPFEGEVLGDLLLRICMDPLPIPSRNFVPGTTGSASGALPASFDAWFAKAVARDRTERHQSAAELASSLAELSRTVGLAATLHSRPYAVREGSMREALEPSRPSQPRVSRVTPGVSPAVAPGVSSSPPAGAAPGSTRQPSNTETNTTVGLVGAAFKVDRRARALALAAIALSAGFGLWAVGNDGAPGRAESVDVHGLRPPFEVTPKTIRPGVPSGRRWQTASDLARAAKERSVQEGAAQEQERAAQQRAAEATAQARAAAAEALAADVLAAEASSKGGVAGAVPPGTVVANLAPLQPSSSVSAPLPGSGGAGSPTSGAASGDVAPVSGAPGMRAAGVAPPSASGQRGFAPGAPSATSATGAPAAGAPTAGASAGPGPSGAVDDTAPAGGEPNAPASKPGSATQTRAPAAPSATPPRALRGTAAPAPRRARAVQPSETSIRRTR